MTPLPPAWGDYDEWAVDATGAVFLRVADFKSNADAKLFNRWAENNYYVRGMRVDTPVTKPLPGFGEGE